MRENIWDLSFWARLVSLNVISSSVHFLLTISFHSSLQRNTTLCVCAVHLDCAHAPTLLSHSLVDGHLSGSISWLRWTRHEARGVLVRLWHADLDFSQPIHSNGLAQSHGSIPSVSWGTSTLVPTLAAWVYVPTSGILSVLSPHW